VPQSYDPKKVGSIAAENVTFFGKGGTVKQVIGFINKKGAVTKQFPKSKKIRTIAIAKVLIFWYN
jgi:hypothetical protein